MAARKEAQGSPGPRPGVPLPVCFNQYPARRHGLANQLQVSSVCWINPPTNAQMLPLGIQFHHYQSMHCLRLSHDSIPVHTVQPAWV